MPAHGRKMPPPLLRMNTQQRSVADVQRGLAFGHRGATWVDATRYRTAFEAKPRLTLKTLLGGLQSPPVHAHCRPPKHARRGDGQSNATARKKAEEERARAVIQAEAEAATKMQCLQRGRKARRSV